MLPACRGARAQAAVRVFGCRTPIERVRGRDEQGTHVLFRARGVEAINGAARCESSAEGPPPSPSRGEVGVRAESAPKRAQSPSLASGTASPPSPFTLNEIY